MDEELKAIVQRMIDAGESEGNIATVIQAYKPVKVAKPVERKSVEVPVKKLKAEGSGGSVSRSADTDSLWGSQKSTNPIDESFKKSTNQLPNIKPSKNKPNPFDAARVSEPIDESFKKATAPTEGQLLDNLEDRGLSIRDRAAREMRSQYEKAGIKQYTITPEEVDKFAYKLSEKDRTIIAQDAEREAKKADEDYTFWDDTWKKIKSNTSTAIGGVAGIPNLISKGIFTAFASDEEMKFVNSLTPEMREVFINSKMGSAGGINQTALLQMSADTQEYFKELSKGIQQEVHQFDNDITDDIANGNYAQASKRIASEGIGSIPSIVQAMIPYVGLASIGAGTAANKQDELEDEGYDISGRSLTNSAINGTAEAVFELVTLKMGGKMVRAFTEVPDVGRKIFLDNLIDSLVKAPLMEGGSEAATSLAQDISDNLVQGKEKELSKVLKSAFEAGLIGSFVGGGMGATTGAIKQYRYLKEDAKIEEIIRSDKNNFTTVSDAFVNTSGELSLDQLRLASKTSIGSKLDGQLEKDVKEGRMNAEQASEIKLNLAKTQYTLAKTRGISMSDNQRVEAVNLINRKEALKMEIKNMDDALATVKKEEIKAIDEKLMSLASPVAVGTSTSPETPVSRENPTDSKPEVTIPPVPEDYNIVQDSSGFSNKPVDNDSEAAPQEEEARTGKQNTEFFTGKAKEASSKIPYSPVVEVDQTTPVAEAYKKFSSEGNFTGHISKMIAGFAEKQKQVAEAIVKGGFNSFLDIGTSEGGMIKTVASQNPNMRAVGIDPNSQMRENFNATEEVPNAEFRQEAWQASWTDADGTVINEFKPTEKFEVVNEDFAFQFMNNNREQQVKGVKEAMTPDGVFITSEKFHTDNQQENEKKKYDHQRKYFDEGQLTDDKQTIVNGMADDMVRDTDYFETLKKNFKFVEEFWNAGNFKGYIASDSQAKLKQFRENVGDLTNEFTDKLSKTNESNTGTTEVNTTDGGTNTNEVTTDSSTTGDATTEQTATTKERAKELADKIRNLKINKDIKTAMSRLNSRPTALVEYAWDSAIEVVATSVELTGNLAQSIEAGLSTLKSSQWYQSLSEKGQRGAERKYRDMFRDEIREIEGEKGKQGFFDKLNQTTGQKFVDIFTNINRELKDFKGYRDLYKREGLYESKAANEVETMLTKMKDALQVISKSKFNPKQVSDFMYARHALDRNAYIENNVDEENPFGSGKTDMEARVLLDGYIAEDTALLETLSKPFYDIVEDTRQKMVESGLISKEAMDELRAKDNTYVPLTGFADEQIEIGDFVQNKKLTVKGREFRKLTGRTTEANNIISNIVKQFSDVSIRASKNEVLQEFQNINDKNIGEYLPFEIHTAETLPTSKRVNKEGKVTYTKDPAQMDDSYVGFKVNGVQKYLKFDNPVLAKNLNKATDAQVDTFTRTGGKINRFLSASFTQYNPEFIVSNFEGDLETALINLKAQADINPDLNGQDLSGKALKGLKKAISTIHSLETGKTGDPEVSRYYEEFKKEGGKTGWTNRMSLKELNLHVEEISNLFALQEGSSTAEKSKYAVKRGVNAFFDVIDNANTSIENGIRLSTYIAARKAGLTPLDAASLSKELTVNFNRRGEIGGLMNTLFLFFNAAVQGTSTFKKNMLKFKTYEDANGNIKKTLNRGQKIALGAMATSFILGAYNQMISDDDEESGLNIYEGIPDYDKERNLIIMSPDGKNHFKIRMPYGYNIFSNIGTMFSEVAFGNRKVKNASSFVLGSMMGSFNPLSSPEGSVGRKALYTAVPTVFDPFVMLAENKDNFNNEIWRENFELSDDKLASSSLGSKNTASFYKNTAVFLNSLGGGNPYQESALNVHPDGVEYLVDYFGGGALKFTKNTYNLGEKAVQKAGGADLPIQTKKIPFLSKFYGEDTNFPERNLYFTVKEKYKARLNYLEKTPEGRSEGDPDFVRLKKLDAYYKQADEELKALRKVEKVILEKENSVEKLEKLEDLEIKKNKAYSKFVKKYMGIKDNLEGDYE